MKLRLKLIVIAFTLGCALGLARGGPDDTAARVAVFEALFAEQAELHDLTLFLAVGDRAGLPKGSTSDPDDAILVHLRKRGWRVESGSHASPFDKVAGVVDSKSGQRGVWFYVGQIERVGPSELLVYGEFYSRAKSAEGARYRLVLQEGAWKVVSRRSIWKS